MFNERLQYLRKERGLTQKDVSAILGVKINTLAQYEKGNREPNFKTLRVLADFFNVSTDYLLGRTNDIKDFGYTMNHLVSALNELPQNEAVDIASSFTSMVEIAGTTGISNITNEALTDIFDLLLDKIIKTYARIFFMRGEDSDSAARERRLRELYDVGQDVSGNLVFLMRKYISKIVDQIDESENAEAASAP